MAAESSAIEAPPSSPGPHSLLLFKSVAQSVAATLFGRAWICLRIEVRRL